MDVVVMKLSGPQDVPKVHELLAQALGEAEQQKVKDIEGVPCNCNTPGCKKRVHAEALSDGRVVVVLSKGPQIVNGIILDKEGSKALGEQLLAAGAQ